MDVVLSASLGILFLVLGFVTVFLMFHLWGYPFDKVKKLSSAPRGLMRLHRVLGYMFLILYLVMMSEMVPRMWHYQVEWPARTVAHMMFGMSIGIVLLIKLSILRFFRHFEEWMPVLGTMLLGFTIVLSALSMPHAFREMALASESTGGDVFSEENRSRVAKLLPSAGLPDDAPIPELSTLDSLRAGRLVLLRKCVVCHDLKTILTRPRSPGDWVNTVERMAIKPAFTEPISDKEQWQAAAYLIAISRELQRSARERRQEDLDKQVTQQAAADSQSTDPAAPPAAIDEKLAQATFERVCSQCHELSDVEKTPPRSAEESAALIKRMIDDNDMQAEKSELQLIEFYLNKKYVAAK